MTWREQLPDVIRLPLRRLRAATREVVRAGASPRLTVRLLTCGNLRRAEPRTWRRLGLAVAVAALLVVAGLGLAVRTGAWYVPGLVVVVFAGSALRGAWNARASRGVQEGLPPGRLGRGPGWLVHPEWFARHAAREGVVFKANFYDVPTVCTVDLATGTGLLRTRSGALGPAWAPYERFVPGGSVRGSDGVRHAELRQHYARTLGPDVVLSWVPLLEEFARASMEALAAECVTAVGVNPREAVRTCVFTAWTRVIFAIRASDAELESLRRMVDELDPDRRFYAPEFTDAEVEARLDHLGALVVAAARADDAPAPVTLAQRFDAGDARGLDEPALLRNLIYTMLTTRDDVAGLLVWVLWHLARSPEWAGRLRSATPGDGVADRFVSEVLRLEQSEFVMRQSKEVLEYPAAAGPVVVPAGWFVRVCVREIHRDEAVFPEATRFDPDRFLDGGCGRAVYAPFGIDHRACLGELLTRSFAAAFVRIAAEFECVTVADGAVELSRQRHWAPSSHWRLRVTRR